MVSAADHLHQRRGDGLHARGLLWPAEKGVITVENAILDIQNVSVRFANGSAVQAVEQVSLSVFPSDKLCIITDIGYDHMHVLGHTLREIAAQKAGIIALGNTVVMYEQAPEIMASVHETVTHEGAKLILIPQEQMNTYFERNFNLAHHAYQVLATRDHLPVLSSNDMGAIFNSVHVPGRLEKIVVESTTFILDGAHNEQKLSALFSTLDTLYGVKKWPILLALKADKDAVRISQIITEHAAEIVVSEFRGIQDTPVTATPAIELAEFFDKAQVIVPLESALQYFLDQDVKEVLVTGSFFAVAEARAWLITHKHGIVEE